MSFIFFTSTNHFTAVKPVLSRPHIKQTVTQVPSTPPTLTVKNTCIQWTPLLSGHGYR